MTVSVIGDVIGRRMGRTVLVLCLTACLTALLGGTACAAFPDVDPGSWCAPAVEGMREAGLIGGYADGTFRPAAPVTAAQFVTIAGRCAGIRPGQGRTGHWAAGRCQAALERGWYDWDELPPTGERYDDPITRQLAVKILMRALLPDIRGDWSETEKISDFAALDGRYYDPVLAAYASGIVTGDGAGRFRPLDGLTRAAACALFWRALGQASVRAPDGSAQEEGPSADGPEGSVTDRTDGQERVTPIPEGTGGPAEHGWLHVEGTRLVDEQGDPVVLRGWSSHGLQWYGQFASEASIRRTAELGANVFRVAMYTAEGGYLSDPEGMERKAVGAVDAAISCGLYVLLDWHILSDGDPGAHQEEAAAFFSRMAERYAGEPAVLYEICNEPNGDVQWERDVRPYAEATIRAIRERSPRAVVLVGSPTWSQDLHLAARSPLEERDVLYTLHFYAGTHGAELRDRIDLALSRGLAVFVSEWGTSRADGDGGPYLEEAGTWLSFLEERGVSWCAWSLCDKAESSAALRPGTGAAWGEADLSASGAFVASRLAP